MGAIAVAITIWAALRLPETLHPEDRRPFDVQVDRAGASASFSRNRMSLCYTLATTTVFGALFGFINSAQQIYVGIYGLGVWFPVLFAAVAGLMAVSSFLNSRLVGRFGMRRLSHGALVRLLCGQHDLATACQLIGDIAAGRCSCMLFAAAMFQFGWIGSNFNALAMEPLGHIAGSASSVQGFHADTRRRRSSALRSASPSTEPQRRSRPGSAVFRCSRWRWC